MEAEIKFDSLKERARFKRAASCPCDQCHQYTDYCEAHDAWYCPNCDSWAEVKCADPACEYCKDRPEKPSRLKTGG